MTTWNLSSTQHHVLICNGASCMRKGAEELTQAIREEIQRLGVDNAIHTTRTRCNGRCEDACVVIVYPEGTWYRETTPEMGREMVRAHLLEGTPLQSYISYSYREGHFSPSPESPIGISKPKPEQTKVSDGSC